jgi:hypothetical protein
MLAGYGGDLSRSNARGARRSALVVENGGSELVGRDDVEQGVYEPLDGQVAPLGFLAEIREHRAGELDLELERRRRALWCSDSDLGAHSATVMTRDGPQGQVWKTRPAPKRGHG